MQYPFEFASRRSPVGGRRGMVATSQPLAVAAGLEILSQGGNAADAAIATAAALNVTEPTSTGIGGDCFALYYDASTCQVTALNGSGRAPAALTLERIKRAGFYDELPPYHPYTITIPGACAGWCDLLEKHGRFMLGQVLAPAIRLAETGFPVAPITGYFWQRAVERQLRRAPGGLELTIDGRAPAAGEVFRNPGLARTLQKVAEGGKAAFYHGEIAEAIADIVQQAGGCISVNDLAAHHSTWDQPISTTYRGVRVWECPPNGQGLAALLALNILEGFNLAELPPLAVERLHLEIEALRLAFVDTRWYAADPTFNPAPLEGLLSKEYAAERRKLVQPDRATLNYNFGSPTCSSDTVYLSVVDGEGNACSFINSNYMGFGTGIVPHGWGFSLQNRGHSFSLDPQHPNALAPGKRPYHTIIPGMLTRDMEDQGWKTQPKGRGDPTPSTQPGDRSSDVKNPGDNPQAHITCPQSAGKPNPYVCSFGVMGGFMQPQGHVQVIIGLIDDQLDPQAVLDRPRFCIQADQLEAGVLVEEGISPAVVTELARMGHPVSQIGGCSMLQRAIFGRGQIILRDPESGFLCGGSDGRADGCAMTY